jgi:hypothetical protein
VSLVGAEGLLRVFTPSAIVFVHAARQVHRYSPRWAVDLIPDSRGRLRLEGTGGRTLLDFVLTVGPDGFRSSAGGPRPGAAGRFIHAIGDSYTMGWGVDDARAYPAVLDSLLPGGPRVLNLGVDGFGAVAATERSRELADRFPPVQVIYLFVPNDFEDDERAARVARRPGLLHAGFEALDVLRRITYLANVPFAVKWHLLSAGSGAGPRPRADTVAGEAPASGVVLDPDPASLPAVDHTNPSLVQIAAFGRFLKGRGARLTVLALSKQPPSVACYRFCRDTGIEAHLIEMPESLRIPGDDHFTVAGNAWLAAWVRDHVVNDGRATNP